MSSRSAKLDRGERPEAGGGELEAEGHPVEPAADADDGVHPVGVRRDEVGLGGCRRGRGRGGRHRNSIACFSRSSADVQRGDPVPSVSPGTRATPRDVATHADTPGSLAQHAPAAGWPWRRGRRARSCRRRGGTAGDEGSPSPRPRGGFPRPPGVPRCRRSRRRRDRAGRPVRARPARPRPGSDAVPGPAAAWIANRVLPVPPGPSRLTRRDRSSCALTRARSMIPADEARHGARQVGGHGRRGAERREPGRQALAIDLHDIHRGGQILEPVAPQGLSRMPAGSPAAARAAVAAEVIVCPPWARAWRRAHSKRAAPK